MNLMTSILLGSALTFASARTFAEEKTTDKAAVTTKQMVYTVIDKSDYTVSFKKGSAVVDQSSRNSLKALFASLKGELTGAEVVIGGFADRDFPMDQDVKLTSDEAKLAKLRASNVEKVIKGLGVQNKVQIINFGEQNSLLSKIFKLGSDAPEVKEALQTGETDSRKIAAVSKKMQDNGGASKAVVLVRRENVENASKNM